MVDATKRNWTEYGNVLVLTFTLGVIIWYTLETMQLRKATQEQLARSYLPLIVLDFKEEKGAGSDTIYIPFIKNVGFGPAFNIRLSDIINRDCRSDFSQIIAGIGKDSAVNLKDGTFCSNKDGASGSWARDAITKLIRSLPPERKRGSTNAFPITITFQDSRGKTYEIAQEVQWNMIGEPSIQAVVTKLPTVE